VRELVSHWPPWPLNSPDALELATRRVADLHRQADDLQAFLVRTCLEAARRRYVELREFLEGKRAAPPR
jgi:lysyl-tRNA synthetase class II